LDNKRRPPLQAYGPLFGRLSVFRNGRVDK
jgi:hypothetical protein